MSRKRVFVLTKAEFRVEPQCITPAPDVGQAFFVFTAAGNPFSEISKLFL